MRHPAGLGSALLISLLATLAGAQQPPLAVVQGDGLDSFGAAVRIAGDVDADGVGDYIVGAPDADPAGDRSGRAWVFSGADHSVLHVFDGTTPLYKLGKSVDGAGDVNGDGYADVIVGEPASTTAATTPGRAYVYSGLDGSVLHSFSGTDLLGDFGAAVAGLGDVDGDGLSDVAVGAPDEGGVPEAYRGSITIFSGADGQAVLQIHGGAQNGQLGWSLDGACDVDGDGVPDLVAGDPNWKNLSMQLTGAVLLFSGATGAVLAIGEGPPLIPGIYLPHIGSTSGMLGDLDGDGRADFFGGDDDLIRIWSGADGSLLQQHQPWSGSHFDPVAADLGDIDGDGHDDLLIGDPEAPVLNQGGMVLVVSGADGAVMMVLRGTENNGDFGVSLAVLGDADSDGRPEFLVGQPSAAGKVFLQEFEPDPVAALVLPGTKPTSDGFGTIVRSAGDVNNDGCPDVIAGEPYDSTSASEAGRATVFSGRDGSTLVTLLGAATIDRLGWSVDGAGDVDRDGYDDLIVGAPFRTYPQAGSAYLYSGRTGAVLQQFHGQTHGDRFGYSVAGVGDVDGDGVPDVFIGSPYDDAGASDAGAARLYSGATGALLREFQGNSVQSAFGLTVGGGGDVDADGTRDLLVWVPNEPIGNPPTYPGAVRIYSGATGVLLNTLVGEQSGSWFGWALDDAGDLDGDGHDDLVVGAPNAGRVYAYSGATGGELFEHALSSSGDLLGWSVAGGQDANGDGVPDVVAGAPGDDVLSAENGELHVLSGVDGTLLQCSTSFFKKGQVGSAADFAGDIDFDGLADIVGGAALAPGQADGEIVIWLSSDGSSSWMNLGKVLPGSVGAPELFPSGTLVAGQPLSLSLSQARPSAAATLIVGHSMLGLPFKGGTLVPQPMLLLSLATNPSGAIHLATTWPSGLPPGTQMHLQYWISDPAGPAGFAASNAVRGTTP